MVQTVQTMKYGTAKNGNFVLGKVWTLPGWRADTAPYGWYYLVGQDSPESL